VLTHAPAAWSSPAVSGSRRPLRLHARACKPYRARTKGKDERMVSYLKHHFFVRYRAFESWPICNSLPSSGSGRTRTSGSNPRSRRSWRPRFAREAPRLQPLRPERFDTAYWESRQVAWDGFIDVRGNRYTVPDPYRGQTVRIRLDFEGQLQNLRRWAVCRHPSAPSDHSGLGRGSRPSGPPLGRDAVRRAAALTAYEEVGSWN